MALEEAELEDESLDEIEMELLGKLESEECEVDDSLSDSEAPVFAEELEKLDWMNSSLPQETRKQERSIIKATR